jgi:hypothetical protein
MSTIIKHTKISNLAALVFSLLMLLGCGPYRIISPYDQVIDEGMTKFHTDVTAFVGKMVTLAGKPEGTYDANKASYPELAAELSSLKMHAAQTPKNDLTVKAIDEVTGNVERLRQLHESGKDQGLSKPLAGPALAAIDVQCESILKLEIAKKRGEQD